MNSRAGACVGGSSLATLLLTLLVGIVVGAGLAYFLLDQAPRSSSTERPEHPVPADPSELDKARDAVDAYIERKIRELDLDPENLKEELSRAGTIMREKSREWGGKLAEGVSDVRIIAEIKAKYTLDRELSGWSIVVGCRDGHVTLSGRVSSPEQIARAVVIALDVNGVVDVVSSLKVGER